MPGWLWAAGRRGMKPFSAQLQGRCEEAYGQSQGYHMLKKCGAVGFVQETAAGLKVWKSDLWTITVEVAMICQALTSLQ